MSSFSLSRPNRVLVAFLTLAVTALGAPRSSLAQDECDRGATVTPDQRRFLVNQEFVVEGRLQRWTIATSLTADRSRIDGIVGLVLFPDSGETLFVSCSVNDPEGGARALLEGDGDFQLPLRCSVSGPCRSFAEACRTAENWGEAIVVTQPVRVLLPRPCEGSSSASSSPSLGRPAGVDAELGSPATLTPNAESFLVNKVLDNGERWTIALVQDPTGEGTERAPTVVLGNVFAPGAVAKFVACEPSSEVNLDDPQAEVSLACRGSEACSGSAEDCSQNERWPGIGSATLPTSFFLPPQGRTQQGDVIYVRDIGGDFPCDDDCVFSQSGVASGSARIAQDCPEAECTIFLEKCGGDLPGRTGLVPGLGCGCVAELDRERCDLSCPRQECGQPCSLDPEGGAFGVCRPRENSRTSCECSPRDLAAILGCGGVLDAQCQDQNQCCAFDPASACGEVGQTSCDGICVVGSATSGICRERTEQEEGRAECGNETLDAGEQCDPTVAGSEGACPQGTSGAPTCTNECERDASGCEATAECGDGVVQGEEECDGGACCSESCEFLTSDQVCRPSSGECDVAELCSGTSDQCPADAFVDDGTSCSGDGLECTSDICRGGACSHPAGNANALCRPVNGECDAAERCDGVSRQCPSDAGVADGQACTSDGEACTVDICQDGACSHPAGNAGTVCRASVGTCDAQESCDGTSGSCPADSVAASGTVCRGATGACDVQEVCNGSSAACPADGLAASGTVCRGAAGTCDVQEVCNGSSAACPADGLAASGTVCRGAAGACDVQEVCNGSSGACPADSFASSSTVCRSTAGVCDVAESCTGGSAACPVDQFASGTVCRAAIGDCDQAEVCSGTAPSCPADVLEPGASCPIPGDLTGCTGTSVCNGACSCATLPSVCGASKPVTTTDFSLLYFVPPGTSSLSIPFNPQTTYPFFGNSQLQVFAVNPDPTDSTGALLGGSSCTASSTTVSVPVASNTRVRIIVNQDCDMYSPTAAWAFGPIACS